MKMYKVFEGLNLIVEAEVQRPQGKNHFKVKYKLNGSKFFGTFESLEAYSIFETLEEAADYLIEFASKRLEQTQKEAEKQKEVLLDIVTKYKINKEV